MTKSSKAKQIKFRKNPDTNPVLEKMEPADVSTSAIKEVKSVNFEPDDSVFFSIADEYQKYLKAVIWNEAQTLKKISLTKENISNKYREVIEKHKSSNPNTASISETDRTIVEYYVPRKLLMEKLCYDMANKCIDLSKVEGKYSRCRQEKILKLTISEIEKIFLATQKDNVAKFKPQVMSVLFAEIFLNLFSVWRRGKAVKAAVNFFLKVIDKNNIPERLLKDFSNIFSIADDDIFESNAARKMNEDFNKVTMVALSTIMQEYEAKRQSIASAIGYSASQKNTPSVWSVPAAFFSCIDSGKPQTSLSPTQLQEGVKK